MMDKYRDSRREEMQFLVPVSCNPFAFCVHTSVGLELAGSRGDIFSEILSERAFCLTAQVDPRVCRDMYGEGSRGSEGFDEHGREGQAIRRRKMFGGD